MAPIRNRVYRSERLVDMGFDSVCLYNSQPANYYQFINTFKKKNKEKSTFSIKKLLTIPYVSLIKTFQK